MRPCDTEQLTLKPFAADNHALVVGEDRVVHEGALGGAGRFESLPTLTLYLSADAHFPIGANLTVNLLPGTRRADVGIHYEDSMRVRAPRIAESRLAFECVLLATGMLEGEHARRTVVVARVLLSHQRWPRGCAIS